MCNVHIGSLRSGGKWNLICDLDTFYRRIFSVFPFHYSAFWLGHLSSANRIALRCINITHKITRTNKLKYYTATIKGTVKINVHEQKAKGYLIEPYTPGRRNSKQKTETSTNQQVDKLRKRRFKTGPKVTV